MSNPNPFFEESLATRDALVRGAVLKELERQQSQVELIASENIVSRAVLEAQGSVLTNKYAEGYPGKRYYGGCEFVDEIEALAIDRIKQLFNAKFANVQPHSGAQANGAVMLALAKPGDTILGMSLDAGGHLTHGVNRETMLIDYEQIEELAQQHKPSLLIAGFSAYPRKLDFARLRSIADSVGAKLMVDMAHIAGIIAAGRHDNPVDHAHVVTSTTHKSLRGPRGGIILMKSQHEKAINSAIFPGLQGGPLMHVIAGKAVAFGEALRPDFKTYIDNVLANAQALGDVLKQGGVDLVTGGTDNHLLLVDLRPKGLKGNQVEQALERAGITCNKNGIPFDTEKPTITSGIRLGTPAGTTRGFGVNEFRDIGRLIVEVFDSLRDNPEGHAATEQRVRREIFALCERFPIY
jgi:glycine hydroxymethyltransferase